MIPVDQEHDDDCLRAAIASILELQLTDVPDFVRDHDLGSWDAVADWLLPRGMTLVSLDKSSYVNCYHLASVRRPRSGDHHAVVMFGARIVHDPATRPASRAGRKPRRGCDPNPMRVGGDVHRKYMLVPLDVGAAMNLGGRGRPR